MRYLPPDQYQRYSRKADWTRSRKARFYRQESEVQMALDAFAREIAEGKIMK